MTSESLKHNSKASAVKLRKDTIQTSTILAATGVGEIMGGGGWRERVTASVGHLRGSREGQEIRLWKVTLANT